VFQILVPLAGPCAHLRLKNSVLQHKECTQQCLRKPFYLEKSNFRPGRKNFLE
jgi:hypothetical protein